MANKGNIIRPTGLKGQEVRDRQLELMGESVKRDNVGRSVVELTKEGPDGKIYAIIRENRKWYIKSTDKSNNLTVESFQYTGGLQNKTSQAYPSYAKAIKHLNLKFISLHESLGTAAPINVFRNDHILGEAVAADAKKHITDKKGKELDDDASDAAEAGVTGDNLVGENGKKKAENDWEKVKMSENEAKIDAILRGEDIEGVVEESTLGAASFFTGDDILISDALSISRGVDMMGDAIDVATGEKKIREMEEAAHILKGLTKEEVISVLENLTGKKKV